MFKLLIKKTLYCVLVDPLLPEKTAEAKIGDILNPSSL